MDGRIMIIYFKKRKNDSAILQNKEWEITEFRLESYHSIQKVIQFDWHISRLYECINCY